MITSKVIHSCVTCGKVFPHEFRLFCDDCASFIDVDYNMCRVTIRDTDNPLVRYLDLLPILQRENVTWMGCGNTPCVHARNLGDVLGSKSIYLKDETKNPTWTTKDRMASVVLSYFKELGIRTFVTCSTGNSSTSLATAVNMFPFLKIYIVTGAEFADRLHFADSPNIEVLSLEGATFVEAFQEAGKFAEAKGFLGETGFFNPARREGLKLAFLEACDQMPRSPDWYFQAVSSAMGVYGAYKAARQYYRLGRIKSMPRFCCVQQDSCCPMVKAWDESASRISKRHIFEHPTGLAKAILRGNPQRTYPYIFNIVKETHGEFLMVTQGEIIEAQRLILETENIQACATSACTVAALKKALSTGIVGENDVVLVNITGREREASSFPAATPRVRTIEERQWRTEGFWTKF